MVHDADDEAGVTNALVRHRERKRFVEDRIQSLLMYRYSPVVPLNIQNSGLLMYRRLLLFHLLTLVRHPDLHIRI